MDGCAGCLDNSYMRHTAAQPRVPAYALYGEAGHAPDVDPLHCESIAARSRLHDWEIRPHRHEALFQVLVVARGRATVQFDGRSAELAAPALVTLPALSVHGFAFLPSVGGWVFTVDDRHLGRLLGGQPELLAALRQRRAWSLARGEAAAREVLAAAAALKAEVASHGRWRSVAIDGALLQLAVAVARAAPAGAAEEGAVPARAMTHLRRYRALVEAQYREQPTLAALARELGITPTQLNRICQAVLGRPALALLHDRLLVEAQRDLAYTAMSVKQIAFGLGFSDAAYFTRFFRRLTRRTPTAWRTERQTRSSTTAMP